MRANGKIIPNFSAIHLLRFIGVLLTAFLLPGLSVAQNKTDTATFTDISQIKDTISFNDSLKISDTTRLSDSLVKSDSLSRSNGSIEERLGIRISEDALEDIVVATATDSAVMEMKTNDFHLYGNAKVDYDGRKLSADKIDFNQSSNIATATVVEDTSGKTPVLPTFEQGSEKFTYDHLKYNFKSQRAIVRNARTQYGEGYMHSEQVKRNADKSLYGYRNVYTTCSLHEPHFGIRTNRVKIIPDQAIAMGSANIEIEGVPTPLFLPFGYFPVNNEKHRSGFLLPGYTVEQARGLGFLKGGYYFYLNDYVDLQLQTDIFTKGSFVGYLSSNYVNRYHYNGNVNMNYAINKTGEEFDPAATIQKSLFFQWTHTKDPKSLPGINFNANVNVQTGNFLQLNSYNANQIMQNQFRSNITFAKNWTGKPYSITASATHNQNTTTKEVFVTLPDITFFVNAQNPFQRRNPVGAARWYEKITVGYTVNALNRIMFYDTSFDISRLQFSDFQNGMRHSIPISANYNVLRFITLSVNASYNEYWNLVKTRKEYNDVTQKLDTTIERGFFASRDFNTGFTLNTQIYGMKLFKRGAIRGFRHTLRPSVGFNYRPDFAKSPFNYAYQARLDTSQRLTYLSPYEWSIVGYPAVPGRNGSVSFGLNNNLQMKVRSNKDTATGFKNIVLLDRLDFNTSYNLAADSFQWSNYVFTASTNIANLLNINASMNFDPYQFDYETMRRTPRTTLASGNGLARLTSAQLGFSTSLHSRPKEKISNEATNSEDFKSLMRNNGYSNYVDFNIPWTLNIGYSLLLERRPSAYSKSDTSIVNKNLTLGGDFNFTPRWKLGISSGYNFVQKEITYTDVRVYRDLHCWEMSLGFIPFGYRKSFNFQLNVKAQVLQDLKLTRRRDFRDAVN